MSDIVLLILEILHRAALILGVIYALDYAHNGKIDLYHPKIKRLKKGFVYRLVMKLADKLESPLEHRKRAGFPERIKPYSPFFFEKESHF